ncbi:ORF-19 [Teiidae poxvirus 1]|nr:ORF-19 [Teiidae poxvirus 1]
MDILKVELEIAIQMYQHVRSMGTEIAIVSPCSILSSLCALGKLTDKATESNIQEILKVNECKELDSVIRSINEDMSKDSISSSNKIITNRAYIEPKTQLLLCDCYKLGVFEGPDQNNISLKMSVTLEASWNRPFTFPPDKQIRERNSSTEIASIFVDNKRRFHLLRRLTHLNCSVIRTSIAYNRFMLTMITSDDEDDKTLDKLESILNLENILDWIDNSKMKKTQNRFRFPKVKMATCYNFASVFNSRLNLSPSSFERILPERQLYLDKMIQCSKLHADANSLYVHSSTEIDFTNKEFPKVNYSSCTESVVGKAFIFLIQSQRTGHVLFFGCARDSF